MFDMYRPLQMSDRGARARDIHRDAAGKTRINLRFDGGGYLQQGKSREQHEAQDTKSGSRLRNGLLNSVRHLRLDVGDGA